MEALVPHVQLVMDDAWAIAGACYDRIGLEDSDDLIEDLAQALEA